MEGGEKRRGQNVHIWVSEEQLTPMMTSVLINRIWTVKGVFIFLLVPLPINI